MLGHYVKLLCYVIMLRHYATACVVDRGLTCCSQEELININMVDTVPRAFQAGHKRGQHRENLYFITNVGIQTIKRNIVYQSPKGKEMVVTLIMVCQAHTPVPSYVWTEIQISMIGGK